MQVVMGAAVTTLKEKTPYHSNGLHSAVSVFRAQHTVYYNVVLVYG